MAIFRNRKKERNFVILDKGFINDDRLSLQATGLLTLMLSLPDDWEFHIKDLVKRKKNGRDSFRACVRELEEAGYLVRLQTREEGKFGKIDFDVYEELPPLTEKPSTVFTPSPGKPSPGKPSPGNPTLLNNKELNNNFTKKDDDYRGPGGQKDQTSNSEGLVFAPDPRAGLDPGHGLATPGKRSPDFVPTKKQEAGSIFDAFFTAFGKFPNAIQAERLSSFLDDGLPVELIVIGIEKAALAGAGVPYAEKVLTGFMKSGIKTVAAYEEHEARRAANGSNGRSHGKTGAPARGSAIKPKHRDLSGVDLSNL